VRTILIWGGDSAVTSPARVSLLRQKHPLEECWGHRKGELPQAFSGRGQHFTTWSLWPFGSALTWIEVSLPEEQACISSLEAKNNTNKSAGERNQQLGWMFTNRVDLRWRWLHFKCFVLTLQLSDTAATIQVHGIRSRIGRDSFNYLHVCWTWKWRVSLKMFVWFSFSASCRCFGPFLLVCVGYPETRCHRYKHLYSRLQVQWMNQSEVPPPPLLLFKPICSK